MAISAGAAPTAPVTPGLRGLPGRIAVFVIVGLYAQGRCYCGLSAESVEQVQADLQIWFHARSGIARFERQLRRAAPTAVRAIP